jgi:hypothetical protein
LLYCAPTGFPFEAVDLDGIATGPRGPASIVFSLYFL